MAVGSILTRGQILDEGLDLGASTAAIKPHARIFLNLFEDTLYRSYEWPFMLTEAALTTTAGSPTVSLSSLAGFDGRVEAVRIFQQETTLTEVPYEQLWARSVFSSETASKGTPTEFSLTPDLSGILLYPTPQDARALKTLYYKVPLLPNTLLFATGTTTTTPVGGTLAAGSYYITVVGRNSTTNLYQPFETELVVAALNDKLTKVMPDNTSFVYDVYASLYPNSISTLQVTGAAPSSTINITSLNLVSATAPPIYDSSTSPFPWSKALIDAVVEYCKFRDQEDDREIAARIAERTMLMAKAGIKQTGNAGPLKMQLNPSMFNFRSGAGRDF